MAVLGNTSLLSGECYGAFKVNTSSTSYVTDTKLDCKGRILSSGYEIPLEQCRTYQSDNELEDSDRELLLLTANGKVKSVTELFGTVGNVYTPIYMNNGTPATCQIFGPSSTHVGIIAASGGSIYIPTTLYMQDSISQKYGLITCTVTSSNNAAWTFSSQDQGPAKISCNGGFFQTSDIRKKENLKELNLDKCYDLIDKCQTVLFDYKEGAKDQMGMIAQEVEEFFPEIVSTDADGFKSLDYAKLTVVILRVLKDLIKKVNGNK